MLAAGVGAFVYAMWAWNRGPLLPVENQKKMIDRFREKACDPRANTVVRASAYLEIYMLRTGPYTSSFGDRMQAVMFTIVGILFFSIGLYGLFQRRELNIGFPRFICDDLYSQSVAQCQ